MSWGAFFGALGQLGGSYLQSRSDAQNADRASGGAVIPPPSAYPSYQAGQLQGLSEEQRKMLLPAIRSSLTAGSLRDWLMGMDPMAMFQGIPTAGSLTAANTPSVQLDRHAKRLKDIEYEIDQKKNKSGFHKRRQELEAEYASLLNAPDRYYQVSDKENTKMQIADLEKAVAEAQSQISIQESRNAQRGSSHSRDAIIAENRRILADAQSKMRDLMEKQSKYKTEETVGEIYSGIPEYIKEITGGSAGGTGGTMGSYMDYIRNLPEYKFAMNEYTRMADRKLAGKGGGRSIELAGRGASAVGANTYTNQLNRLSTEAQYATSALPGLVSLDASAATQGGNWLAGMDMGNAFGWNPGTAPSKTDYSKLGYDLGTDAALAYQNYVGNKNQGTSSNPQLTQNKPEDYQDWSK